MPTISPDGVVSTISLRSTSSAAQTNVPFTFGYPFKQGDLLPTDFLIGATGGMPDVPLQFNVKATHPDGSVRHAIISGVLPTLAANASRSLNLVRKTTGQAGQGQTLASYVAAGLNATVSIVDGGATYTAKVSDFAATAARKWLTGGISDEWLITAPLKTSGGAEHPLMHARFYVRAYAGLNRAKIDIVLENTWVIPAVSPVQNGSAWVNNTPTNVTYDVTITVPGDPGYSKAGIVHYNKARWAQTFWWNGEPGVYVKHDPAYVIATKAVPNYRQDLTLDASVVSAYLTKLAANNDPMKVGVSLPAMSTTGSRTDIAIHPSWCVLWLLFGDADTRKVSIRTSQLTGGWSVHYRNKATDNWISIAEYPYATTQTGLSASGDLNPVTKLHEAPPAMATASGSPNGISSYHLHNPCYIPYLLTGDFVHLEELQAWNEFSCGIEYNPTYRNYGSGGVYHDEPRGVAWRLRHLVNVAYISPEGDPIKSRTLTALDYNLDYFNSIHVDSTDPETANALGFLNNPAHSAVIKYTPWDSTNSADPKIAIGSYQDEFMTSAVGLAVEQGFTKAIPFLRWKAKFPVGRLCSGADFCFQLAAPNTLTVCATPGGPIFTTWAQVWNAMASPAMKAAQCGTQAMADAISAVTGETGFLPNQITKYASGDLDYCSQLGPAVAYAADSTHPQGNDAWLVYDARAKKPAYVQPSFAIIPRNQESTVPPMTAPVDTYQVASGQPIYGGRAAPAAAPTFDALTFTDTGQAMVNASYDNLPLVVSLHGSGGGTALAAQGRQYVATVSGNAALAGRNEFKFTFTGAQSGSKYYPMLRPVDSWVNDSGAVVESQHQGFLYSDGKFYLVSEHRYDLLMDWVEANNTKQNLRTKVLIGASMGAWGTLSYGIRRYNRFAALYADRPRWRYGSTVGNRNVPTFASGWVNYPIANVPPLAAIEGGGSFNDYADMTAYISNTANKVRWIGWCVGRQDGFSVFQDHIEAVAAMRAAKRGFAFYWNNGDHSTGSQPGQITQSYPYGTFSMDKGYPLFTECSTDQDPNVDLVGGINIGLSFRNVVETASGWSCEVTNVLSACTVKVEPISDVFKAAVSKQSIPIPAANTWVPVSFSA